MDKKDKMCKVRLRRLRPDMVDKLRIKRVKSRTDVQISSLSSESEHDDINVGDGSEQISVKLRSPLVLGSNKDFDPYVLLTEAQALKLSSQNECTHDKDSREDVETATNKSSNTSATIMTKPNKIPKHFKSQSCYSAHEEDKSNASSSYSVKLKSIENNIYDLIYYHSDDESPYSYNCNHAGASLTASVLAPSDRRSSTGSSSSLLSDKPSMRFSKVLENNCISVMDHENPPSALSKILSIKEFDPLAPQQILAIIIKSIVSLADLSQRDDNLICIDIDKQRILEYSAMSPEEKKNCPLNPFMDASNIVVTHSDDEFLTFCLCENCEKYREFVIHIMVEQFKATHMVVMLLDVLIKSYGPMLKNITAYNKFEKLLDSNKEIYWITCGVIYHKKAEHLDLIYDEYLSDNMTFVLFSSILMLNNPLLLLQILAFHVECIVKAYAEGFLEIVEPDRSKIPAEEMISYILNGYDDLMSISEQVASYLFAFENDFLRKFSLTWKLLSQRLYQQHVHMHLADTMLACIITMKEEELTSHHTDLIKRYIQFDDIMNYAEKRWTDVWIELNKFNLSEVERKRRKSLLDVYRIFDTVVQDAIGFSLQDSVDDNNFYDFRFLKNRRLAWKNIMSYTKMKWPDGFFQPPNTLVIDDKCQICNVSLEYHADYCKCVTCSIAGGPLPPRRNADGKCSKCLAHEIVEKDFNFYDSKILSVCASDDFQKLLSKTTSNGVNCKNTPIQEVRQELYPTLAAVGEMLNESDTNPQNIESKNSYHISWAVFNHLNNRKRYPYATIEEHYFCRDCKLPSCLLALKILNNKISPSLSQDLVHYYQPVSMSREELRSILPNIMLYNRKLVASNNGLGLIDVHDLVVKIYWIFIISIYAIYFIDYGNDGENAVDDDCSTREKHEQDVHKCKTSHLDALELENDDIKVNVDKLTGNTDDTKFLQFLDKVKSLSPYNNDVESNYAVGSCVNSDEMQQKLNDFLKITDSQGSPPQCDNVPQPIMTPIEDDQSQPSEITSSETVDVQPKKSSKEKSKKCCFDHSDIGAEHCKENHSSKKRLRKDCNHARMNETRDRLRKKLSQIVNARKNAKPLELAEYSHTSSKPTSPTTTLDYADARNIMEHFLNPEELKLFQHYLPRPDFWDIHDFVASFDHIYTEARRTEEKKNLCECLQNLKTNSKSKNNCKKIQCNHHHMQLQHQSELQLSLHQKPLQRSHDDNQSPMQQSTSLEPPNQKSDLSNNTTHDISMPSQGTNGKENDSTNATAPISSSKVTDNIDFVNEICEIIDNYSKEQAKRKWIKETLSFIEGPTIGMGKKKTQPQTLNPKKAAKKAKQKQRKEEEKRIAELHDFRAQFHNIYFKEFSEKLNLKSAKANKKKDKKKIIELENNIKNLQRAKAKVETAILELIATVKQTNTEFKFPYLPTKEQQMEKVRQLEGHDHKEIDKTIKIKNLLHQTAKGSNIVASNVSNSPFAITPTNNLNMVPESYSMPYAQANHFPYNLGFATPAAPAPFGLMRTSPMCYAPPSASESPSVQQQQNLAPDVVTAIAANGAGNNTTDPSKRIVTIRRVNLPNVPEPQVTVTAKGPSPDKDKLLYTFINGQLIQTGTAPPITIPQMQASIQPQLASSVSAAQNSVTKLNAKHLLSIPPPPPPKLSKTQVKKERKRLAKLHAETEAAEQYGRKRIEEEQRQTELKKKKKLEIQQLLQQQQKQQPKNKNKILQTQQQPKLPIYLSSLSSNNKDHLSQTKNKLSNSNSTTSAPTNETIELPKLPQMMAIKNSAKQKRSDSTTTSCSAATSTSSNNSTSSQMNTRDNSVSSLRPVDLKGTSNKNNEAKEPKIDSTQKSSTTNKTIKTKAIQLKQKQCKKQTKISPTPSTTSTDAEHEVGREFVKTKEHKLLQTLPTSSKTQKQKVQTTPPLSKQKVTPQKLKMTQRPITPPSSDTETEEENELNTKEHKKRRPKLVDNGQFDNNPFKYLHMQDSETEWSSAEEIENEENENENIAMKRNKRNVVGEKIIQNHELKLTSAKINVKTASHCVRKNVDIELREDKTKQPSTCLPPGNKNATNKCSKNIKYQQKEDDNATTKQNDAATGQKQILLEIEHKINNQTGVLKKSVQQQSTTSSSNSCRAKNDNRALNAKSFSCQTKSSNKLVTSASIGNETNGCSISSKSNGNTNRNNDNKNQNNLIQTQHTQVSSSNSHAENKNQSNKRSQRNKKYQQKSSSVHHNNHQNCCSFGIPNNMGYFNANEVNLTSSTSSSAAYSQQSGNSNTPAQSRTYQTLAEQMQALRLSGHHVQSTTAMATAQQHQEHINSANVSIMDQLNRGVQVENLTLPPGITLTKVDPIKSEQLRQKTESIKKLAKPLQQQHHHQSHNTQAFRHSSSGAAIIAPPIVNPIASFYGSPYINAATAGIDSQSGVIMVEANPPKSSSTSHTNLTSHCNSKQSKNKKRRNKSKAGSCPMKNSANNENSNKLENSASSGQPKMITLRNPMFHSGPKATAATILQQPVILPGRPMDGFPMSVPLPVDQPAAIIKNENGMYTIRNPALHQAVTSGLVLGGYRQFGGNVNYYTPQEAAAEAARATLQQQQQQQQLHQHHNEDNRSSTNIGSNTSSSESPFSYFSNDTVQTNAPHNNISISCTTIGAAEQNATNNNKQRGNNSAIGLIGDAAAIQRPSPPQQRPISAIGSEIKSAQQQKHKTKVEQQQWSNFVSDTALPLNKTDNLGCNTSFLGSVTEVGANSVASGCAVTDLSLQEKYQQSKYYNGFDVFTGSSGGSSSSTATCVHMHHSCGDDSPPPSITGYNSYLEGIPNTGVIRYDDASFLKNLIPGQNLNTEVSIHNINDSNFVRNEQSPQAHRVEITPVYGNRPPSTSLYEPSVGQVNQTNFRGNYRDPISDYNDNTTIFPNNMHVTLNELETSIKYDYKQASQTTVASVMSDNSHNTILNFKDLLIKNGPTGPASHRTSPYLDENTLEGIVQNMNTLQISNASCEEQSSQLNGSGSCIGHGATTATSANNASNGWW